MDKNDSTWYSWNEFYFWGCNRLIARITTPQVPTDLTDRRREEPHHQADDDNNNDIGFTICMTDCDGDNKEDDDSHAEEVEKLYNEDEDFSRCLLRERLDWVMSWRPRHCCRILRTGWSQAAEEDLEHWPTVNDIHHCIIYFPTIYMVRNNQLQRRCGNIL